MTTAMMDVNLDPIKVHTESLIKEMFEPQTESKRWTYNPLDKTVSDKLSIENFRLLKNQYEDITTGNMIPENDNRFTFRSKDFSQISAVGREIEEQLGGQWFSSGTFWYPPNGYCGWHTNSNCVGKRIYIAYAEDDNESFFRYYDAEKDEVVTEWDKKGLNSHYFEVNPDKPCWHSVGSLNTNRISFGFRTSL